MATVTIKRVTEADAGQYVCIAQNEYGRETAVIDLRVEEHNTTHRNTSGKQIIKFLNLNLKQQIIDCFSIACCVEEGVSELCLSFCKYEIDFNSVFNRPECFSELNKFMYCAAGTTSQLVLYLT